jgi:hypothetical protein
MILNLALFDSNGRSRPGAVKISIWIKDKKWSILEDSAQTWPMICDQKEGPLEIRNPDIVVLQEVQLGKAPQILVELNAMPITDRAIATAGTGKVLMAKDPVFAGGGVFWGFVRSSIREAMQKVLKKCVPKEVLTSDDPEFKVLTGYDTARLKSDFWEHPTAPNKTFTTCNLTLGNLAIQLGNMVGKKCGPKLQSGPLQLDDANKDVPGCWVVPGQGERPDEGDFYSVPYKFGNGWIQKFGHVGTIAKISGGTWISVDGGQGGSTSGIDKIKWIDRGPFDPNRFNGWVNIDKYFGS